MDTVFLILTKEQANNLLIFLDRVTVTGRAQARELAILDQVIQQSIDRPALPEPEEAPKKKGRKSAG